MAVGNAATGTAIDELLAAPAFGLAPDTKSRLLREAVSAEVRFHAQGSALYRAFCDQFGFDPNAEIRDIADIPALPVQAFKEAGRELRAVPELAAHAKLTSSATSGAASTVFVDAVTSRRQVKALAQVMQAVLGTKRRPFWVFDVQPGATGGDISARAAATRGFLSVSTSAQYLLRMQDGVLTLDEPALAAARESSDDAVPLCLFGFTYVLYSAVIEPMVKAGRSQPLPDGSVLVHIGGWKKLKNRGVSDEQFRRDAQSVFGCRVVDIYGFTEQIGVLYPECAVGVKHAPACADVIVRDPVSLSPVPDGVTGILEFVTPLPHSYAGAAVLTDDLGVISARDNCGCGWGGTAFRVVGRTQNAELRGCGDVLAETVARPRAAASAAARGSVAVIFDGTRGGVSGAVASAGAADVEAIVARVRDGQRRLAAAPVDDLIALMDAAAQRWADPAHSWSHLRQHGLSFLSQWCRADRLRRVVEASLGCTRLVLDGFVPEPGTRRSVRTQPRGLSVHWLAGNAPTLGLLSALMCLLAKNGCVLKAPASQDSALPTLLEDLRLVRVTTPGGRELSGELLTDAVAVLQFGREQRDLAEKLSVEADVRVAWGGAEAVQAVMHMPRRYGTDDLVFGPRLSLMVIGRESLRSGSRLRQLARRAAVDASVFDQYACASPHVVFVERGGEAGPEEFAARLAEEMDNALSRLPKTVIDGGVASAIQSLRIKQLMNGRLWCSNGLEWTIAYGEGAVMPAPVYSRSVFVQSVDDVFDVLQLLTPTYQTVGLALDGPRRLAFADGASSRGVERLPDIGRMTDFDAPWDGMRQMSRLVRWITLGAPL